MYSPSSLRDRLAKKEKERRLIDKEVGEKENEIRQQNDELVSLRATLGGATASEDSSSIRLNSVDLRVEAELRKQLR